MSRPFAAVVAAHSYRQDALPLLALVALAGSPDSSSPVSNQFRSPLFFALLKRELTKDGGGDQNDDDGDRADTVMMMATTTTSARTPHNDDNVVSHDKEVADDASEREGSDKDPTNKESSATANKITIDGSRVVDKHRKAQALYKGAGLAPMVRCSTTPLRALAFQYGANFCYTEEIVDRSLVDAPNHSTCQRVERVLSKSRVRVVDYEKNAANMNAKVRRKQDGLPPVVLRIDPELERNRLICQLGTGHPDWALQAAMLVHRDVASIDVNMGCPKKFSTTGGMGSALLNDPQRACDIIRKLDSHLSEHPVSAKIRLLSTALETIDFVTGLINAGASAVAIHARRVGDPDTKDADWTTLKEVVTVLAQKFPAIPICINGDFYTRSEFLDFMRETKASAVLLARPALYNPSIFVAPPPSVAQNGGTGTGAPLSPSASSSSSSLYGYDSPLLVDKTTVVQDYMRNAVKYETHWKNVKYVVCEMLNIRRTPASRVAALLLAQKQDHTKNHKGAPFQRRPTESPGTTSSEWTRPTIGETCACKSLEAMCEVWRVSSGPAEDVASAEATVNHNHPSEVDLDVQQHPAGDHTYSDTYILNRAHEAPAAGGATDGKSAAKGSSIETNASSCAEAHDDERVHPAKRARADL